MGYPAATAQPIKPRLLQLRCLCGRHLAEFGAPSYLKLPPCPRCKRVAIVVGKDVSFEEKRVDAG